MMLPILIAVGLLAALAGGRPRPQGGSSVVSGRRGHPHSGGPTATAILMEFIRLGRRPPPALVASALAEAQRAGQGELAMAIVDTYIRPVVEASERGRRGGWSLPPATPPITLDASYGYASPPTDPYAYGAPPPYPAMTPQAPSPIAPPAAARYAPLAPASPSIAPAPTPPGVVSPEAAWSPGSTAGPTTPMISLDASASDDDILRMITHLSGPPTQASAPAATSDPPGSFDPTAPLEGPPSSTGPGTITVSGRSSPIDGVGTADWARFCDRMSRELPTYTSAHHVGQFRQRRGRLLELGIEPETVLASPDHQRAAFDVDMSEAFRRAHAAGLLACVGHPVEVPTVDGPPQVAQVTTSGVLGVVQAAGVEGALGWFRSPGDRRRFAGTTAVFSRANGVF